MPVLTSKTRSQGSSVVTTLPAEVARRLGVEAGQELHWIEDGSGGFRVVPASDDVGIAMEAHEEIMKRYDGVFRKLAQ